MKTLFKLIIAVTIFTMVKCQGFPLMNTYQHYGHQPSRQTVNQAVRARNIEKGIYDFKKLITLVDIRSKLYDEAIRLSNVFPGQTNTVPVPNRYKSRLIDSEVSWSCLECDIDVDKSITWHSAQTTSNDEMEEESTHNTTTTDSVILGTESQDLDIRNETDEMIGVVAELSINSDDKESSLIPESNTPEQPSQSSLTTSLMFEAHEYIWDSLLSIGGSANSAETVELTSSIEDPIILDDYQSLSIENVELNAVVCQDDIVTDDRQQTINVDIPEGELIIPEMNDTKDYFELNHEASSMLHDPVVDRIIAADTRDDGYFIIEFMEQLVMGVPNDVIAFECNEDSVESMNIIPSSDSQSIGIIDDDVAVISNDGAVAETPSQLDISFFATDEIANSTLSDITPAEVTFTEISSTSDNIVEVVIQEDFPTKEETVKSSSISSGVSKDDHTTIAFSAIRIQLLVGSMAVVFFLCMILAVRIYHWVLYYPTNLVLWLDEESCRLFAEGNFADLIAMLSYYMPRVEYFFGIKDLETIALLHYLARGQMALSQYDNAEQNLDKLLTVLLPYGEDEYLASIYEDCGFVYHAQGKYKEAIECLHKALRIISEEQVCQYESTYGPVDACKDIGDYDAEDDQDRLIAADDCDTVVANLDTFTFDFLADNGPANKTRSKSTTNVDSHCTIQQSLSNEVENSPFGDELDALTTSLSPSSSLMRSFGSPSTLDLNEAFFVHSDLSAAVKELEAMLDENNDDLRRSRRSAEMASWRDELKASGSTAALLNDNLFGDFLAVPSLEVTRLCKKLGEVYCGCQDFVQARLFYFNALAVARRLSYTYPMDDVLVELEDLLKNVQVRIHNTAALEDQYQSKEFDPDVYNRFWVDAST